MQLKLTSPTYIVAGGPSVDKKQINLLRGAPNIITVNDSFRKLNDDAAVCYGGDYQWWKEYHQLVKGCTAAQLWTGDAQAAKDFSLNHIQCRLDVQGLGTNWIVHGGNSGLQALNLAYIWGAKIIILLGFDCKYGPKGERHHYPDHPKSFGANAEQIKHWQRHFESTAKAFKRTSTRVINCSPDSALTCFEKGDLHDWI